MVVKEYLSLNCSFEVEYLVFALVVVDLDESTEDFYKVICEDGVEGYCMKDYIEIAE